LAAGTRLPAAFTRELGVEKQTHFDFITSIALMILSVVMIVDCCRINGEVGGAIYASPGMLPMLLAIVLLFTAFLLFKRSIRANGIGKNFSDFIGWLSGFVKSTTAREMMIGGLILAIYTFGLAPRLPFWLSTSIFMIGLMLILRAASVVKSVLITVLVVGSLYAVFQSIFHVPLP
jgi:hypothetical protein